MLGSFLASMIKDFVFCAKIRGRVSIGDQLSSNVIGLENFRAKTFSFHLILLVIPKVEVLWAFGVLSSCFVLKSYYQ